MFCTLLLIPHPTANMTNFWIHGMYILCMYIHYYHYRTLTEPVVDLLYHQRRVGLVLWHPAAQNVLLTAGKYLFIYLCDFLHILGSNVNHTCFVLCIVNNLK